tara:strand:+ start:227 stop:805 length:579 start_codon:yes stop_codon:yes gene_type:complete
MKMDTSNVLLTSLYKYYKNENNMNKLIEVLNEGNNVSLRIIDWFVTNFSKKHNICYNLYRTDNKKITFNETGNEIYKVFNTYHAYKSQLKSYSKKRFDPFCRRERISFPCKNGNMIETTIGQLNFFKWAIDNLILDFIEANHDEIEIDMNSSYNSIKKQKKNSKERKKRQELSKSASRGLNSNNYKVVLSFS